MGYMSKKKDLKRQTQPHANQAHSEPPLHPRKRTGE
ncbi:hypothetical protein COLO4_01158 [Corchorus olitorius]|nr:hypothetical protein COLO4_01158 [Corchorus olitorius]